MVSQQVKVIVALMLVAAGTLYYLNLGSTSPFYTGVTTRSVGEADTMEYKLYFWENGRKVSPWHHIPLRAEGSTEYYTFVNEVPKGATAKMEINKESVLNPIIQDIKKGKLRYYHSPSLVNYGAIPQTWEDPSINDPDVNLTGDNDPLDVLEIGEQVATVGEVYEVKVIGALGMIDDGEMDWKIITVRKGDPVEAQVDDLATASEAILARVEELRVWFRDYKIPDGKPANKFAFEDKPIGKVHAEKVIAETHQYWKGLIKAGDHKDFWLP